MRSTTRSAWCPWSTFLMLQPARANDGRMAPGQDRAPSAGSCHRPVHRSANGPGRVSATPPAEGVGRTSPTRQGSRRHSNCGRSTAAKTRFRCRSACAVVLPAPTGHGNTDDPAAQCPPRQISGNDRAPRPESERADGRVVRAGVDRTRRRHAVPDLGSTRRPGRRS